MNYMDAPFPWFGGKRKVAPMVWERLGNVEHYSEPFFGSGAVLLGRPHQPRTETVNDKDHFICNFWRAVRAEPEEVAKWADNPANEDDLTARHIWLVKYGMPELERRIPADPDYYNAKIAGWWVWGLCCWIGSGWCNGNGCWTEENGEIVKMGNAGQGVNRAGQGVKRKLVSLGNAGKGMNRPSAELIAWMSALSERLRGVRVCCGNWERIVTPGALSHGSTVGIFLDPPYSRELRYDEIYNHDDDNLQSRVLQWCIKNYENPRYRIALCGYEGEYNVLEGMGWDKYEWKAGRSYGNGNKITANAENRAKERIWFSPYCLPPVQNELVMIGEDDE